ELIEKKILARYRSPMVPFLRKGFVDPEGYWPGVYAIGYTIIYNKKRGATNFLRQIAREQRVTFSRQSHTFMTQLVATGEHDVIVDGYMHNAVALKEKGAPIDYVVMNPTIVRPPSIIAILARAPHPYAAALLVDYHLSKEASEIMVKSQGRWAPRKDVPWSVEPQGELHVVPA